MTHSKITDVDWQGFDVKVADLDRLEDWLMEQQRGIFLKEITRRMIRGRLRFGADSTISALPEHFQPGGVLSWNQEDQWEVGLQVLVARRLTSATGEFIPDIGIITEMTSDCLKIQFSDREVEYKRHFPGSEEARELYDNIMSYIERQEQIFAQGPDDTSEEKQIDIVFLEHGDKIASKIQSALNHDERFVNHNNRWFLKVWVKQVPSESLFRIQKRLWREKKHKVSLVEIRELIPAFPEDEFGDLSLSLALSNASQQFRLEKDTWQVLQPPPPPPEKAEAAYYVYDPQTYKILLQPGDRMNKKLSQKLQQLGFYDAVVEWVED